MKTALKIFTPIIILWLFLNDGQPSELKESVWALLISTFAALVVAIIGLVILRLLFWIIIRSLVNNPKRPQAYRRYLNAENGYLLLATAAIPIGLAAVTFAQSKTIAVFFFGASLSISYWLLYRGTVDSRDTHNFELLMPKNNR